MKTCSQPTCLPGSSGLGVIRKCLPDLGAREDYQVGGGRLGKEDLCNLLEMEWEDSGHHRCSSAEIGIRLENWI